MNYYSFFKPVHLAVLFIKEQLIEPVALFWTVVSPVVTYYLITYARAPVVEPPADYLSTTSWFYAFVSSSVALFGLAFYIVGRRESGFLRSFVYTRRNKVVFLSGQFLAYSMIAIVYGSVFYVCTRVYSGVLAFEEYLIILGRFYVCFILFSIPALLLTLAPLGFQNASAVFSILSLTLLAGGVISIGARYPLVDKINVLNPMWWANQIMVLGVFDCLLAISVIVVLFMGACWMTFNFLLINPVWSRY